VRAPPRDYRGGLTVAVKKKLASMMDDFWEAMESAEASAEAQDWLGASEFAETAAGIARKLDRED